MRRFSPGPRSSSWHIDGKAEYVTPLKLIHISGTAEIITRPVSNDFRLLQYQLTVDHVNTGVSLLDG